MPSDYNKLPLFHTLPSTHSCFWSKVLQFQTPSTPCKLNAELYSTPQKAQGSEKAVVGCFKRKKKLVFLIIFPCFPPPCAPHFGSDDILQPLYFELEQLKTGIEETVSWQGPGASLVRRDGVIAHCQRSCFIEPTCSSAQACVINPVF